MAVFYNNPLMPQFPVFGDRALSSKPSTAHLAQPKMGCFACEITPDKPLPKFSRQSQEANRLNLLA
jgi:hypothetical protein